MLAGKTVVIGVTGGIAAYKVLDIIRQLRKQRATVHVILTASAQKLVGVQDFEKVSGNKVHTSLWNKKINYQAYLKNNKPIPHISLADIADIFVVCPATANVIAKATHGIADDLLTTSLLATSAQVLVCPAMNVKMWHHRATQNNIKTLKKYGYEILEPEYGMLACGYEGIGRLANVDRVVDTIDTVLKTKADLKGKKILISAGATSEPIDAVRVITNKSSGKMGIAIAEAAVLRGASVTLIQGHTTINPQKHMKVVRASSVAEMHAAMKKHAKTNDIIVHAAAVSDYSSKKSNSKIKSGQNLNLELSPTTKIFEKIKSFNKKCILVGFKAEFNVTKKELIKRSHDLLKSAHAEFVVANDVGKKKRGFDGDTNEVFIVDKNKNVVNSSLQTKQKIAHLILDTIK